MDRMVFDKLNYGLYVVGVFEGGRNYGCLISSFFQITSGSPQKCAIVLNRDNRTCEALLKAGTLTVSMAAQDASRELLSVFGYRSSRVADKFAGLPVQRDAFGNPYLTDRIAAWASLKVTETIPVKNYYLFICDAVDGQTLSNARLMTMDEFLRKGPLPHRLPPRFTVRCGKMRDGSVLSAAITIPARPFRKDISARFAAARAGNLRKKRADGVLLRHRIGREASYVQHAGGLR